MNKINVTFESGIFYEQPKNIKEEVQSEKYKKIEEIERAIKQFKKENDTLIVSVSTIVKKGFEYMINDSLKSFFDSGIFELLKDKEFIKTLDIKNTTETKKERLKAINERKDLTNKQKLEMIRNELNF